MWRNWFYWFLRICGYAGIRVVICGDVPCTYFEYPSKQLHPPKPPTHDPLLLQTTFVLVVVVLYG